MPAVATSPYDNAESILQLARANSNDAVLSIAGQILSDNQPYIWPLVDGAFIYLRKLLTANGVNAYSKYGYCKGLTAVQNPGEIADPTIQVQLMYTGYFNGVTTSGPASNPPGPTLPADLLEPLEIWERQSGSVNRWQPVRQVSDSISTSTQTAAFGEWDWENDILYLPGATQSNDLKLKYIYKMPTITGPTSVVPIKDCKDALSWLIIAAACYSRGGQQESDVAELKGRNAVKLMVSQSARREEYASFTRKPFRSHGSRRGR